MGQRRHGPWSGKCAGAAGKVMFLHVGGVVGLFGFLGHGIRNSVAVVHPGGCLRSYYSPPLAPPQLGHALRRGIPVRSVWPRRPLTAGRTISPRRFGSLFSVDSPFPFVVFSNILRNGLARSACCFPRGGRWLKLRLRDEA